MAWLGDADPAIEWAVPVEFCTEPDGALFGRLLIYLGQLWLEIRPTDAGRERFAVGAVVVNLTGSGHTSRWMRLRRTGIATGLEVAERDLSGVDAAATLAVIAAGSVSACVLPWIPLMKQADEDAIIRQWRELAGREPDAQRRSDYGGLALVFAEAAGRLPVWKEALKEWNMRESQQVLEWINMGRAEGEANALLRLLARRFPPGAPADLEAVIRATTDLARLDTLFDLALAADSLDAFRQASSL